MSARRSFTVHAEVVVPQYVGYGWTGEIVAESAEQAEALLRARLAHAFVDGTFQVDPERGPDPTEIESLPILVAQVDVE